MVGELGKATIIDNPGDGDPHAAGVAKGGGAEGSYTATFHGPTDGCDTQPHSVVGEFDANFSNGSAVGAYGARKQN